MKKQETKFGDEVKKHLQGALILKVHGHAMQAPGWPDLQVYHKRWTGHLELKVDTEVTTAQSLIIKRLIEQGTPAFVLRKPNIVEDRHGNVLAHLGNDWLGELHALGLRP